MNSKLDYRQIMRDEYENRCRRNARYSLRAFARDLELAPSRVSEIFNNGRGISPRKAMNVARLMGYNQKEQEDFVTKVQLMQARSPKKRIEAREKLKSQFANQAIAQMSSDTFESVAGWHHMAILELTYLKEFSSDIVWIANRLGISASEAKVSIERLLRLGLLTKHDGRLTAVDEHSQTQSDIPSRAIKEFHSEILRKAAVAVYSQNIESRDLGATVIGINSSDLPAAKNLIRKFRAEMAALLQNSSGKDAVYCLSTQFFKLDSEK